jgi:zinc protease
MPISPYNNFHSDIDPHLFSMPGVDDIYRRRLPNGMIVLSRANHHSPSVFISGILPAGSLFDSDEKLGLADFTTTALMRGTETRNFFQIYNDLESVGASLGVGCGSHSASFNGRALVEDFPLLLELLVDVLRFPTFPDSYIQRIRSQLLTALAIRSQSTGEMAALLFDKLVYQNHPYSRPEDGFEDTIQAITREDIIAFHETHYRPQGMIISVVGGVDPLIALEEVENAFGEWHNPKQQELPKLPLPERLSQTISDRVDVPEKSQADILIGAAGPSRFAPNFLAASLGNNILGQFGMMGRIGEVVREKAGLAYYASSSLGGGPGPAPWEVSAGVSPENIEQAIELIVQEIKKFTNQVVTCDELEDSKANFIGRLPLSLESNAGVAAALISIERYQLGLDYYREYPAIINEITAQEILDTAQEYLDPDRLVIAVAGP